MSRIIDILKDSFDPKQSVEPFSLQLTAKFTKKLFNSFSSLYSGSYNYIDVVMVMMLFFVDNDYYCDDDDDNDYYCDGLLL